MIKVNIDSVTYHLPSNFNEYSLEMGVNINRIKENNDNVIDIEVKKEILSELIHCDIIELDKVTDQQIDFLYGNLNYLNDNILLKVPDYMIIKGKLYRKLRFDELKVKDYYKIEYFINNNMGDNLHNITSSLYVLVKKHPRLVYILKGILHKHQPILIYDQLLSSNKASGDVINIDPDKVFNDVNYILAKSVVIDYLEQKMNYMKQYGLLEDDSNIELIEMNDKDNVSTSNNITDDVYMKWGVYHQLQIISNNDINQINTWLNHDVLELYTRLKYQLDCNIQTKKELLRNQH